MSYILSVKDPVFPPVFVKNPQTLSPVSSSTLIKYRRVCRCTSLLVHHIPWLEGKFNSECMYPCFSTLTLSYIPACSCANHIAPLLVYLSSFLSTYNRLSTCFLTSFVYLSGYKHIYLIFCLLVSHLTVSSPAVCQRIRFANVHACLSV